MKETRRLNNRGERIPEIIHIAADRDTTRILSAWVGNDTNPEEPWRPIVETIRKDFAQWRARYLTLEGKQHIVQMIAGGKTQFLTHAQGMPNKVQDEIQKMINKFIWEKEVSSMNIGDLSWEIGYGGWKVLNIKMRNEAIDLMWVKDYLRMGEHQPKWAFLADEIFRMERPKQVKETLEEIANWNLFTQDWRPKYKAKHVLERVQRAMRLATKYGVKLEASRPSLETRTELLIWLHHKANHGAAQLYKKSEAKCLKVKHKAHYVHQMVCLVEGVSEDHRRTNFCMCRSCQEMSGIGCTHPHGCVEMACKPLDTIAPTWRPTTMGEWTHTLRELEDTLDIVLEDGEEVVDNPTPVMDLRNLF